MAISSEVVAGRWYSLFEEFPKCPLCASELVSCHRFLFENGNEIKEAGNA